MPGWITDPPVAVYKSQNWTDCRRLVRELRRNIEDWGSPGPSYDSTDALNMCGMIHDSVHMSKFGANDVFFVYLYGGHPLAVMLLTVYDSSTPYVDDLVAHPGAEGGGATLVECALNYLKGKGKPENLKLWALNKKAVGPYLGMGFISVKEEQDMFLDPTKSSKWQLLNGRWYYTSVRNPGHMYAQPL